MLSSNLSWSVLIHLAGVVAMAQLILSSRYPGGSCHETGGLANSDCVLHGALDRATEALSALLPLEGVHMVMSLLPYLPASLYILYLAR